MRDINVPGSDGTALALLLLLTSVLLSVTLVLLVLSVILHKLMMS